MDGARDETPQGLMAIYLNVPSVQSLDLAVTRLSKIDPILLKVIQKETGPMAAGRFRCDSRLLTCRHAMRSGR